MKQTSYIKSLNQFAERVLIGDPCVAPYTNNYIGVHAAALENTFLMVKALLDEPVFAALTRVYAQHYPASLWDLNRFGERFSEFLRAQAQGPRGDQVQWRWVASIADLEYAIALQYYADLDLQAGGDVINVAVCDPEEMTEERLLYLNQLHPYLSVSVECVHAQQLAVWRQGLQVILGALDRGEI
ncbi:putative DNA-binding domain-containing protein [uncultured Neptuniibacter sp.]|uniref:HvfC/BufC family peptide modification chaperone n=1 Tax=uncultured Neptuniibacter sp. TaxID=502143 RepID=UPI002612AC62|nr:putative DNA-binding domain-containing protein [uncultured Neptuniibacter sp.]